MSDVCNVLGDGLHPSPDDCTDIITCQNGTNMGIISCGNGLVANTENPARCVYPADTNCSASKNHLHLSS